MDEVETAIDDLNQILKNHKVGAIATECVIKGPLMRFTIPLGGAIKIKKLESISEEIFINMKAYCEPLIVPGRVDGVADGTLKLDLMSALHPIVPYDELAARIGFEDPAICEKYSIPLLLGTSDIDQPLIVDLQKMPHALIAGVTGSGKSMLLHTIIKSIKHHSAHQGIRLALIDPKLVEFGSYEGSRMLRYSVGNSVDQAMEILEDLHKTMMSRLALLAKNNCRDILEYRALGKEMPFIVVVIDELAELMRATKSGFPDSLCSLAEKGRAPGIHIIAATQHPAKEVITGLLKAQFPTRMVCKVATQTHSRVALDMNGAEKLMGDGDALLLDARGNLQRFKGAFVNLEKKPKLIKKPPNKGLGLMGIFNKLRAGK